MSTTSICAHTPRRWSSVIEPTRYPEGSASASVPRSLRTKRTRPLPAAASARRFESRGGAVGADECTVVGRGPVRRMSATRRRPTVVSGPEHRWSRLACSRDVRRSPVRWSAAREVRSADRTSGSSGRRRSGDRRRLCGRHGATGPPRRELPALRGDPARPTAAAQAPFCRRCPAPTVHWSNPDQRYECRPGLPARPACLSVRRARSTRTRWGGWLYSPGVGSRHLGPDHTRRVRRQPTALYCGKRTAGVRLVFGREQRANRVLTKG